MINSLSAVSSRGAATYDQERKTEIPFKEVHNSAGSFSKVLERELMERRNYN